ncbi:MAG TPA: hypothetical protein VMW41_07050 [Candidatus Bathyarchaeia archaeon]|nr:hypothetical protein [Candidatus Bathyarchaeia archaeon]
MVEENQIILSTDGKHTVIVPVSKDWEADLENACAIYDQIVGKYGLKCEQYQNNGQKKEPVCPIHKKTMTYVENGKYGPFWSCRQKMRDGGFCKKTAEA